MVRKAKVDRINGGIGEDLLVVAENARRLKLLFHLAGDLFVRVAYM